MPLRGEADAVFAGSFKLVLFALTFSPSVALAENEVANKAEGTSPAEVSSPAEDSSKIEATSPAGKARYFDVILLVDGSPGMATLLRKSAMVVIEAMGDKHRLGITTFQHTNQFKGAA